MPGPNVACRVRLRVRGGGRNCGRGRMLLHGANWCDIARPRRSHWFGRDGRLEGCRFVVRGDGFRAALRNMARSVGGGADGLRVFGADVRGRHSPARSRIGRAAFIR
jgi:hypothetical protein